jgi:fluoride exporter
MFYSLGAIAMGAAIGALLRWFLGLKLNTLSPMIPMGTLGANWIGGYLIGIAIAFFSAHPTLSSEWKLFIITGFLGALTTFSTFSAEIVTMLQQGRFWVAAASAALHLGGSVVLTFLGIATYVYAFGAKGS